MIYKKDANFPYPVLTNTSTSYEDPSFLLDVSLEENTNDYRFIVNYEVSSPFIKKLISTGDGQAILIIQSKDNKFYKLDPNQNAVSVPKKRVSLSKRTSIQLHIQSNKEINFRDNDDLTSFYGAFKDEITVPNHALLGYSNIVVFEGSIQNPLVLFEKKLDEQLTSDIRIELGVETIIIHYRKEDYQFTGIRSSQAFNNPYIYAGLRTALQRFIHEYSEQGEDYVDLSQITQPENLLDFKLYQLMTKKMVQEVSVDNIDEVISLISDKIIEKYAGAVKELINNGN
ncbi:hypothetical protein SAMN05192533_10836 [Mesobacillus persicus]|uniref:Uncharacterized protein n=1 Tax=Mesobacillus persicus TaxID=930146 RepID=A0A1H8D1M9_9BACI|nr:hypothetical protein [Mesobacillus persicus]SEN01052.1 hypothetical protein SAMN05192533_10836 [Mesobacillus persicus]